MARPCRARRMATVASTTAAVTAAAAMGAMLAPVAARALPVPAITVSGTVGGVAVPSEDCGRTFDIGITVGCARTGASSARFAGSGRGDAGGRLRGEASARHAGATTETRGSTGASWLDRVEFTPFAAPVTGIIFIRLDGRQGALTDGDGFAVAARTFTVMRLRIFRDDGFTAAGSDEVTLVRTLDDYGTRQSHSLGGERITRGVSGGFTSGPVDPARRTFDLAFDFVIDPGLSRIWFNWQFATSASVFAGFSGLAATRYFSTASITGFQFLDAAGKDVTDVANPGFPSGQPYPVGRPELDVPQPASLAALAAGLGLLGALRRRRSRATR